MSTNKNRLAIFIIPAIYLIWSIQLNIIGGPFSLSRSDPEYPYLLNGLNCANLSFNNIGHTDHPGTPFQVITGVFLRITHVFTGQGPIVQDVLSRPEMYLASASLYLSFLTFLLLYWLGRIVVRSKVNFAGAIILQSSFFLSAVLIDMPIRYNPDRILIIYVLILTGLTVKYILTENSGEKTYAIISGIIMGIGMATKFNFLPVLIVPLLLIQEFRNRFFYGLSVMAAFFIGILPILNKFKDFRHFITGVASHDGLYGQGSQQIINWKSFGNNFLELLVNNPAYSIILLISVGIFLYWLLKKTKPVIDIRLFTLLKAFILASLIGFILVSKHFKVYYFAPVLSFSGLTLFLIWKISGSLTRSENIHSGIGIMLTLFLAAVSAAPLPGQYQSRIAQKNANLLTQKFYAENVTRKDLMFIEPTWIGGPMVENALVYGISYVAHRHEFYQDYARLYPQVITWEGKEKNPWLFRTAEADPESILFSGKDIFVYSSPGRNAGVLMDYLDTLAARFGTGLMRDTVFINQTNDDRVIRMRNRDSWSTRLDTKKLLTPLELSSLNPVSENFQVSEVKSGDYLEVTLRVFKNDPDARVKLIVTSLPSAVPVLYFEDSGSLQNIGHGWQLLRLRGKVDQTPADGKMNCLVYYPGSKTVTVQDLQIKQMGRR